MIAIPTAANRASIEKSMYAKNTIMNTSAISDTIPAENISARFSRSLVNRVTSRPTGYRSKNAIGNF